MKLTVHVKPNSRKNTIEILSQNEIRVHLTAPPAEGKANKQLIELLSEYYDIPKSSISIKTGASGRIKIIEIGNFK